jgi:hypothetical protein
MKAPGTSRCPESLLIIEAARDWEGSMNKWGLTIGLVAVFLLNPYVGE